MKEKISFNEIIVYNRWLYNKYQRNCDWVIFGLSVCWFSPERYCYKISVFGIDLKIWFKREFL